MTTPDADLVFDAPKGGRLHNRFMGITTFDGLVWSLSRRAWVPLDAPWAAGEGARDSHAPCRSLKAFKRHLRKHSELDGHEAILVSRFVGFSVTRPAPSNSGDRE